MTMNLRSFPDDTPRPSQTSVDPLLLLVRGRQLAFGRKKENQPTEQKGHTTDYHRNANHIHQKNIVAAVSKIAKVEFQIAAGSFWRASSCPRCRRPLSEAVRWSAKRIWNKAKRKRPRPPCAPSE